MVEAVSSEATTQIMMAANMLKHLLKYSDGRLCMNQILPDSPSLFVFAKRLQSCAHIHTNGIFGKRINSRCSFYHLEIAETTFEIPSGTCQVIGWARRSCRSITAGKQADNRLLPVTFQFSQVPSLVMGVFCTASKYHWLWKYSEKCLKFYFNDWIIRWF